MTFQTAVAQAEIEARDYPGHYHRVAYHRPDGEPGLRRDDPTRADRQRGGADRPPRRRALPAAVRDHRDLAGLRRRDPGGRPPPRRDGQGRRHRDVLHLRRPDRRAVVARAPAAGAHGDRPRRAADARDAAVDRRRRRGGVRRAPRRQDGVQRPRGDGRRCCASPATSTASRRPTHADGQLLREAATSRSRSSRPGSGTSATAAATRACATSCASAARRSSGSRRTCGTATTTGSAASTATG